MKITFTEDRSYLTVSSVPTEKCSGRKVTISVSSAGELQMAVETQRDLPLLRRFNTVPVKSDGTYTVSESGFILLEPKGTTQKAPD